ncbi:MAG: NrfD/PsrC family molybdoenzyme membrane anchor subunit [Adlercreutzia sp.]|nr:NrfD/PsrC family molybdoenzyme membrane anchor subunit [Adlercreutzia sp.]
MESLQVVWGWQPALYLFLGGMGAGAFLAAMMVHFRAGDDHRRLVAASIVAAVVCLVAGLLLLLSELISPLRGMMMWQSFINPTSWMTVGAWVVFAAVAVFALTGICLSPWLGARLARRWPSWPEKARRAGSVLGTLGVALAVGVAAYTGILLMSAPGVPLWNTGLLPCLFTVSALDTGVALVELIACALGRREPLGRSLACLLSGVVVALVLVEGAVLATLLVTVTMAGAPGAGAFAAQGAQSAALLVSGPLAAPFWILVVVLGLALPLGAAIAGLASAEHGPAALTVTGAAGALAGGCALRFLVVMAGVHADPVLDAVVRLMA